MEAKERISGLIEFIVKELVDKPEEVSVASFDSDDDGIDFELTVDDGDVGRVIGRHGRVITAMRNLVRAAGSRDGIQASLELVETDWD